jgi:hypothetical protein
MPDFHTIRDTLQSVITDLKLVMRPEDLRNAQENLDAGEFGEALDTICQQLYENETPINQGVYDALARTGSSMQMDQHLREMLLPLISHA